MLANRKKTAIMRAIRREPANTYTGLFPYSLRVNLVGLRCSLLTAESLASRVQFPSARIFAMYR